MSSLVCQNVGKVWDAPHGLRVEALRGINLTVSNGEFIAILGPSGCGKSTLLELIAGLETVTEGEILINGNPVNGPCPEAVMVFQDHSLFPWLSVEENISFGLKMKGVSAVERRARARDVLAKVHLAPFINHFPHQLSGGMKQRVAIARALVGNPEFILMDEPFAALDFQTRVLMQQFLLKIWSEFKSTILFVTHHVDEAILLADRVLVLSTRPGMVIEELSIVLERPRSYTTRGFNDYRVQITTHMEREVMRANTEEAFR